MKYSEKNPKSYRALYRSTNVEGYEDTAHVFALDYYKPESNVEDDFSRKEAWFYYMGDDELEEEFGEMLDKIIEDLFVDNTVEWDIMTLAPSNNKDELNQNMLNICRHASESTGIEYKKVLRRSRDVYETGELEGSMRRIINLQNSIEVSGNVKGLNIILVDNVSIYGFKLAHMTEMLLDAGAERVFCVCLGLTNHGRGVEDLEKGVAASTAVKTSKG